MCAASSSHGTARTSTASTTAASVRLFFALWPDDEVRSALARYAATAHAVAGGRTVRADAVHLTLAFLGDTPVARLPALFDAASRAVARPFTLVLDLAAWWKHNRIVWVGTRTVPDALTLMVADLRAAVAAAGFRFDPKPFVVHATLIRNAAPRGPLPDVAPIEWQGDGFVLVRSTLGAGGSRYEVVGEWRS
jgi:2'-5' RNA ligase